MVGLIGEEGEALSSGTSNERLLHESKDSRAMVDVIRFIEQETKFDRSGKGNTPNTHFKTLVQVHDNDAISSNERTKQNKGSVSTAFSTTWLPSDRRAITYMLYRKLTQEYLRNTLLRLRASDQTIEKAIQDLRKLKTLTSEPERELKKMDDDALVIGLHGDGSGVKGLSPFVFTPLHCCEGEQSVLMDSVSLLVDVFENKYTGDSEWKPRKIVVDLVNIGTKVDSNSPCSEEQIPVGRDTNLSRSSLESWTNKNDDIRENGKGRYPKSRRGSSSNVPYILGRIGKIFRRRSAVN